MAQRREKRKHYIKVPAAKLYVLARPNNTLLTLTQPNGNPVTGTISAGTCGFSNCRKSTPYATTVAINTMLQMASENFGVKELDLIFRGYGMARDMLAFFKKDNIMINSITDDVSRPYGGCRAPRRRKV